MNNNRSRLAPVFGKLRRDGPIYGFLLYISSMSVLRSRKVFAIACAAIAPSASLQYRLGANSSLLFWRGLAQRPHR